MLTGIIFLVIGIAALSFFAFSVGHYIGSKQADTITIKVEGICEELDDEEQTENRD